MMHTLRKRSAKWNGQFWRHRIYDEIRARMRLQGCLCAERMCQLAEVSRAGFYLYLQGGSEAEEALALRSAIQDVVMEHRWRYWYRRVTEELRTQGWIVNHKRIARILKREEIYANTYRNFEELQKCVEEFIEQYYNVSITLGARLQFTGKVRKRLSKGIRESFRGGYQEFQEVQPVH